VGAKTSSYDDSREGLTGYLKPDIPNEEGVPFNPEQVFHSKWNDCIFDSKNGIHRSSGICTKRGVTHFCHESMFHMKHFFILLLPGIKTAEPFRLQNRLLLIVSCET
jgi:hypothetical protein